MRVMPRAGGCALEQQVRACVPGSRGRARRGQVPGGRAVMPGSVMDTFRATVRGGAWWRRWVSGSGRRDGRSAGSFVSRGREQVLAETWTL